MCSEPVKFRKENALKNKLEFAKLHYNIKGDPEIMQKMKKRTKGGCKQVAYVKYK